MESIDIKIKDRCIYIQEQCFNIFVLLEHHDILIWSRKMTVSGDLKKFQERLEIEKYQHGIIVNNITKQLFLNIANIFEPISRSKTNSVPNLIALLKKNLSKIEEIQREKLKNIIGEYQTASKTYETKISLIKQHRDNCISHNGTIENCTHLKGISSHDIKVLIKTIIDFIDKLAEVFNFNKFDFELLKKAEEKLSYDSFNQIKKMES